MKKIFCLLMGMAIFSISPIVFAIPEIKSNDQLFVTTDIAQDAYFAGGMVVVDGNIDGDLVVAGGTITVNGNIKGDLIVAGGTILIKGNVGDDARIAGGNITLLGSVGDDMFVAAGTITLDKSVAIGGSAFLGGGLIHFQGLVKENLEIGGGQIVLGGQIGGDVNLTVDEKLEILPTAQVQGSLTYRAYTEENFDKEFIRGTYQFEKMVEGHKSGFFSSMGWATVGMIAFSLLSTLVLGILFVLYMPYGMRHIAKETQEHALKSFGFGLLAFIAAIVLMILSFILGITWKIGLITLFALGMFFVIVGVLNAYFLAYVWMRGETYSTGKTLLYFLGALVVYELLCFVPVIGWVFCVVISLMSLGSLVTVKKAVYQKLRKGKMI